MYLHEATLYDFCGKFAEAVKDGWEISSDIDKFPQILGNEFYATLVKPVKEQASKDLPVKAEAVEAKPAPQKPAVAAPVKKGK